jgi:membrane protease YdiL (CAAX protease family)
MNNKFPRITIAYIIVFIALEWLLQIATVFIAGDFANGTVNQLQGILLIICMFVPAIVLIFFCLFKKTGWKELGLRPLKVSSWPAVFGIILTTQLIILISILWISDFTSFVVIDGKWKLNNVATIIRQPNNPLLFMINILLSMAMAAIISIPQAFGEELAWRGYLQPIFIDKFGEIKGIIFLGTIWGLFHLPINLAGYNYPDSPVLGGFIYMTLTCISLSAVFGWIRIKTNSVWPTAAAHGAYNVFCTVVNMAEPRINTNLYYLYINGVEILIGIFFMRLIINSTKNSRTVRQPG